MAYPKPLAKKTIDKMLSGWDPEKVKKLHTYYEAFANLYGVIQLKDAWTVFKKFEPKIHKKEFISFSDIARREAVPYYIFEIDELYSDEKRIVTERAIVKRDLVFSGYGKYRCVYYLFDLHPSKKYYDKPDLLTIAQHPIYDKELKPFIEKMMYIEGEHKGKPFSQLYMLDKEEQFFLDFYKGERSKKALLEKANIPFSEKLYRKIIWIMNFSSFPIKPVNDYLDENDFIFENKEQIEEFVRLFIDCINKSHLWSNRGYSPEELHSVNRPAKNPFPPSVNYGPGIVQAVADGTIDRDEIEKKLRALGFSFPDKND